MLSGVLDGSQGSDFKVADHFTAQAVHLRTDLSASVDTVYQAER